MEGLDDTNIPEGKISTKIGLSRSFLGWLGANLEQWPWQKALRSRAIRVFEMNYLLLKEVWNSEASLVNTSETGFWRSKYYYQRLAV